MPRTTLRCSLLALALLAPAGCSDDTKPGTPDVRVDTSQPREGGALDQAREKGSVDKGTTTDGPATAKKVEEYVPKDNELAGWTEDPKTGKLGVEAGYTKQDIEAIIDGSNDPYATEGENGFAKQDYAKSTFKLALYLWDMKTAAGAKKMFEKSKTDGEANGLVFENVTVSDDGILANDNPTWKAYGYKSHYTYKIYAKFPDPGQADALKPDVIAFMKLLAGKLP